MDNNSIFMTVQEVAEYLNISLPKCRALIKTEGFPALQIGRTKMINRKKLDAWIDKNIGRKILIKSASKSKNGGVHRDSLLKNPLGVGRNENPEIFDDPDS